MSEERFLELREYLRILRKGWVFMVVATALGIAIGFAASSTATPVYQSSTKLYVSIRTPDDGTAAAAMQGSTAAQQKVQSYADIVTSSRVLSPVIKSLGLKTTASALAKRVSAASPEDTVLVNVTVQDASPRAAARIANAVGSSFSNLVMNELEPSTSTGTSLVRVVTVQSARVPSSPVSPRPKLNLAFGGLLGLAAGVIFAIARVRLDTRIRGMGDVESIVSAPVLGAIAFDSSAKDSPLVMQGRPRSPIAEAYRSLRTNLQFVNLEAGARCFVITSALPSEGKTTTVSNLAIALAESGASVALVDGDLRRPTVAETLGVEGAAGLTDVLIGQAELRDVLQPWGRARLSVLPAGVIPPNPSELLGSRAMVALLETLNETFDFVIIDAPPLLPVTDAAILSRLGSGAVLVAAVGRTHKKDLAAAERILANVGNHAVGVVLTMVPTRGPDAGYYRNYGDSYYGPALSGAERRVRRGKVRS